MYWSGAVVLGTAVVLVGTASLWMGTEPNACEMSYMHPHYLEVIDTSEHDAQV